MNIEPVDGVTGNAVFKWEGDGVDIDEATITLETGLKGVPFGVFNSHMITDPLVKDLADGKETLIQLGYSADAFEVGVGVFNGDLDVPDSDQIPDNYFATASFNFFEGTSTSISWTSDLGEAGLEDYFLLHSDSLPYIDVAGFNIGLSSELGLFAVEVEYVTALDEWQNHLPNSAPIKPSSLNTELAYSINEKYGVAARYEISSDFPGHPEARCSIAGCCQVRENLSLGLEYLISDYENSDDNTSTILTKLVLDV